MKKTLALGVASLILVPTLSFAQTATTTTGVTNTKGACAAAAVEKRDSSIITAHTAFNTSIINAVTARKDGLKAAYMMESKTAAQDARKATNTKFKTDAQAAHNSLRTARKAAWNTFTTDMRACGVAHTEAPQAVLNPSYSL